MEPDVARRELLLFISHYDGAWYWDAADPSFEGECREAMRGLLDEGLVERRPNAALGPPERYWLTQEGRDVAARLHGAAPSS